MPYASRTIDRLLAVRWTAPPTLDDLSALTRAVATHRAAQGRTILYCAVIPPELSEMPPAAVADDYRRRLPQVIADCDALDMVIEATGVRATLLRGSMRAMGVVGGFHGRIFIHPSIAAAAARLGPLLGRTPESLSREL